MSGGCRTARLTGGLSQYVLFSDRCVTPMASAHPSGDQNTQLKWTVPGLINAIPLGQSRDCPRTSSTSDILGTVRVLNWSASPLLPRWMATGGAAVKFAASLARSNIERVTFRVFL